MYLSPPGLYIHIIKKRIHDAGMMQSTKKPPFEYKYIDLTQMLQILALGQINLGFFYAFIHTIPVHQPKAFFSFICYFIPCNQPRAFFMLSPWPSYPRSRGIDVKKRLRPLVLMFATIPSGDYRSHQLFLVLCRSPFFMPQTLYTSPYPVFPKTSPQPS